MGVFSKIYRLVHPVYSAVRSHPLVIRSLFGVKTLSGETVHWDTTTTMLKHALKNVLRKDDFVFEMGVGQAALLSLWIAKTNRAKKVEGADVSPARVASAIKTAELNKLSVQIVESNLFSNIKNSFDVIFFNPPYVRTSIGRSLNLTERLQVDGDQVWDGGEDGTSVIAEFLKDCKNHLLPGGSVLVGVQDYYVKHDQMEVLVKRYELKIVQTFSSLLNPSVVYRLQSIH